MLWTIDQAAEYLQVKPRTLSNWRYRNFGPPGVKIGGLLRYRREEVERWLAEQEAPPCPTPEPADEHDPPNAQPPPPTAANPQRCPNHPQQHEHETTPQPNP
jgi:excisionase family DNA binding protein